MFDIRGTEMREDEVDLNQLNGEAQAAREKLRQTLDRTMRGPISPHARKLVDAYGNSLP